MAASTVRREGKTFDIVNLTLLMILLVLLLYPLFFTVVASLSEPSEVVKGNVVFWVKGFTLESYQMAFNESRIWRGYANSLFYTVFGTLFNLCLTIPAAYFVSKKELPGRQIINVYFLITMYFSGGLIPTYLIMKQIHMIDQWYSLIFIGGLSVYNMIITRTFIQSSIPYEMYEAASIDGCNDTRYFFSFVLPLSKAIIAVNALFSAVNHWNAYFNAMIYLNDREKLPLQNIMRELLVLNEMNLSDLVDPEQAILMLNSVAVLKYSLIVVATAPILCAYPFAQKYFVKGVMIGSIKG